jgi:hypothetical protein
MIGNGYIVAVPDKLDIKVQFKYSEDPKMGGRREEQNPKSL